MSRARPALALIVVPFAATAAAQEPEKAPRIAFESEQQDWGEIGSGRTRELRFVFRNEGGAPLEIEDARTSCSCSTAEGPAEPVPPGGLGVITVQLDTRGREGFTQIDVYVRSNDHGQRGGGVPGQTVLVIQGEITTPYRIVPRTFGLGYKLRAYRTVTETVRVSLERSKKPFKVVALSALPDTLRAEALPVAAEDNGGRPGYDIVLTVDPAIPEGPLELTLTVTTDVDAQPALEIPIRGFFSQHLRCETPVVVMQDLVRSAGREQVVIIESADVSRPPVLIAARLDSRAVAIVSSDVRANVLFITLAARRDAPPGPFAAELVLDMRSEEVPRLIVPVLGTVTNPVWTDFKALATGERVAKGTRFAVDVRIREQPGSLTGAAAPGFEVTVTPVEGAPGRSIVALVASKDLAGEELASAALTLSTDLPGLASVALPFIR